MTENILQEADRLTGGDRNDQYGHPSQDFQKVVDMAKTLGLVPNSYTIEDHCLYMVLVKLSRQVNKPKRDNIVDAAGYLRTLEMCQEVDGSQNGSDSSQIVNTNKVPYVYG